MKTIITFLAFLLLASAAFAADTSSMFPTDADGHYVKTLAERSDAPPVHRDDSVHLEYGMGGSIRGTAGGEPVRLERGLGGDINGTVGNTRVHCDTGMGGSVSCY